MKIKWRYPGGECWLSDSDFTGRLKAYSEIPILEKSLVSNVFNKPANGEIAFCVPIFMGGIRSRHVRPLYTYGYIKRAFWLAYEMAEFTDLIETGSGFYIVIEAPLRPLIEPYRQACEFPEDRIIVVGSLANFLGYMPKIAMLQYACQETCHKYYLNIDTATHISGNLSNLCKGLQQDWNENPEQILIAAEPWAAAEKNVLGKSYVQKKRAAPSSDTFYIEMPRYFGVETFEHLLKQTLNPNIVLPGNLYGVPRSHIASDGFEDFLYFVKKTKCLELDESFLVFYWNRFLAPDRSYLAYNEHLSVDYECRSCETISDHIQNRFFRFGDDGPIPETYQKSYIEHYENLSNRLL